MFTKAAHLTRPTPARRHAPLHGQGRSEVRDAKNHEAHGAMNNEHHVCARRRDGEPAVSVRTTLEDFFNTLSVSVDAVLVAMLG